MDEINIISEKYRKYLSTIKLDNNIYYYIAGSDISKDFEDKLLLDNFGKILLFNSLSQLPELNLKKEALIFDAKNFNPWLDALISYLMNEKYNEYTYALYDFDWLHKVFIVESLYQVDKLTREKVKEFVDYINLVDDYAIQIKNIQLQELTQSESIRLLWETYYDVEFWEKDKIGTLENLILNFNEIEFKINFAKIYANFISNFHFYK